MIIIYLLAIFGLAFAIKETDGPWGVMSRLRIILMQNKYVGVFFYKLLDCYFCTGFHAGWIVYLLTGSDWKVNFLILWGLTGGAVSLILDAIISKLRH